MTWTVRCQKVSKRFSRRLKSTMWLGLKDLTTRVFHLKPPQELRQDEFWALKDVSFELKKGESLGIMGVNGSGKTTLLRILTGIFYPDHGEVQIQGRVGALIALGAGFSPLLTGRENIYVNGSMLGMNRDEIRAKEQEIIAFAGLEESIDMPVKHYSSGMYVRLGFAIAAVSQPDVLIIDEALAVGDMNFQKKCFDYLLQLKKKGTSIILVSHSPGAIWSICDRGILLHHGVLEKDGPVEDVIKAYDEKNFLSAQDSQPQELQADYSGNKGGTGDVTVDKIWIENQKGTELSGVDMNDSFVIKASLHVKNATDQCILRFAFDSAAFRFVSVIDSYEITQKLYDLKPGHYTFGFPIHHSHLRPGNYKISVGISKKDLGIHLFFWARAKDIIIHHPKEKALFADPNAVVQMDSEFFLERQS